MSFSTTVLILFGLMIFSKILDKFLIKSEKIKKDKRSSFNLYSNDDFHMLVKEYINNLGYSNLVENQKGQMMVYNDDEVVLIGYRQTKSLTEEVSKDEIMNFIADMNLKSVFKGIFITNGVVSKEMKELVKEKNGERFNINFKEGIDTMVELNNIKLNLLKDTIINREEAL